MFESVKIISGQPQQATFPLNMVDDHLMSVLGEQLVSYNHSDIYMHQVDDAYVSAYGLAFKNARLIKESVYCLIKQSATPFVFYKKILQGKVVRLDKECVLFHHVWYDNYYHWFTECYPRLVLMWEQLKGKCLIVNENLKPFHRQSLAILPCADIYYCKPEEVVRAKHLTFVDMPSKAFGIHHPDVVKLLRERLEVEFKLKSGVVASKNIYTSRAKVGKRKCINEKEVLAVLANFGFEEVIMDDLGLKDQFELFQNVANVAGVHGSSFVNGLFMPKNSLVIDMVEERHNDLCYFNFLNGIGVNYLYLPSSGQGPKENYRDNDILPNIHLLESRLKKYLYKP